MTRHRLTFDQFEIHAAKTANMLLEDRKARLANWCMGLAGESGELVDEIKKHLFHGKPLDVDAIASELGDVLWYLAALCREIGVPMNQVAHLNLDKLERRHGDAFKLHDQQERDADA